MVEGIEKISGQSMDIELSEKEKLKSVFPQCFNDGKLDIDKLLNLCGEYIDNDFEKYKFEWKGKSNCYKIAGKRSTGTLRPCKDESVNFDTTKNLYIEGDNLEVLKLLQNAYFRKVKMIYIDPPYNTGNDFVYEDDFADPMAKYKEITQQTTKSNPETMGRFHTNWLNMMYPRLRLASNLLRDDGVFFISIDGNEIINLKKICDEVFGEENLVSIISNSNNPKGRSDDKFVATAHEYIVIYAKNLQYIDWYGFEPTEEIIKRYNKSDNEGRKYREIDLRKTGENDLREDRPNLFYYFYYNESTGEFYPSREDIQVNGFIQIKPQREDGKEGNWRWGMETALQKIDYLIPKFMPARKVWGVMEKDLLEKRSLVKPTSSWTFKDVNSERGSEEFIDLGFDKRVFPKPKPIGTIKRCLKLSTTNDDIILDFFSGSATTAHSLFELNIEDKGNRRFILVQLPEKCEENSEAFKAGYKNICEIGKERIRRAGKKLLEQKPDLDIGFRVFKLDTSNLAKWDSTPTEDEEELKTRFLGMADTVKVGRTPEDLVYEVMLKLGIPLDYKVIPIKINDKDAFAIGEDCLVLVCTDKGESGISGDDIRLMCDEYTPAKIVTSEEAFADDSALSNAYYILKDKDIEMEIL
ncbi:MAG: site-specific DNA-methyltransferase [Cyanobacteriota bacterium]|nr:site-specific DNA-methyltransferase [Cyanobacteriota bacterium]MDY6383844.1 site-specific DNA-methyltransferase [Cyanobacteriota bacterium]